MFLTRLFRNQFYSVNRPSSFTHDSWKQSISADKIEFIGKECKEFMERLDYKEM